MKARTLWLFGLAGLLLLLVLADQTAHKPPPTLAIAKRAAPTLHAALERPLFSPTRRAPPPPPLPPQAAPVPTPPDATVLGVVTAGGKSAALIRISGVERRVQEGDAIDGWTVASIAQNGVGLRLEGHDVLLGPPAAKREPK